MNAGFLIILIVLALMMYVLLIRPQKAQQKKHRQMLDAVKPGDEIVTIGGIYADVVEVLEDKLVVEISEGVHIEVARRAIGSIVPAEEFEDETEDEGEPVEEALEEALEPGPDAEQPAEDAGQTTIEKAR